MAASIVVRVRLGPLVFFEVHGASCKEVSEALEGYEVLSQKLDSFCSDLGERIYPDGMDKFDQKDMEAQNEV